MYSQQDLRLKLQERRNRLYKATFHTYGSELKYFSEYLQNSSYLKCLIEELKSKTTGITLEQWKPDNFGWQKLNFPNKELEKIKICFEIIASCVEQEDPAQPAFQYAHNISSEKNMTILVREFTDIFVDPFVNYLHDQIDEGGSILYLLHRYKNKVEWFHRQFLFNKYKELSNKSEAYLDANLREFLMDQGIDYPFSAPLSPSGRVDIVANLDTPEPLVLEVKIFDIKRKYDRAYIKKGFTQVYSYAADYNKCVGYLLIFNACSRDLIIKTVEKNWPPKITINDKNFFVIIVNLFVHSDSASKRKKINSYEIDAAYLSSKEDN